MKYKTSGTCSQEINIEIKDGVIDSVQFVGGCNGNLKGICALVWNRVRLGDVSDILLDRWKTHHCSV